jgi:16S rRNA (cytosine1402-N4)-methyltransferase
MGRDDTERVDGTPATRPARRVRYKGKNPRAFHERYKELNPAAYPGIHEHVRSRGVTPAGTHVPILVREVMAALAPAPGEVVADCTLGYGGHAREFLLRVAPGGSVLGLDRDGEELRRTVARLAPESCGALIGRHADFGRLEGVLAASGLPGVDVIFADLGVSSMQIDDPARGFGYRADGPLDMRMDPRSKRTAADLVAAMTQDELAAALRELADEEDAEAIAAALVRRRGREPIVRTLDLASVVAEAVGPGSGGRAAGPAGTRRVLHPAARTFQALRILVNDELGALGRLLDAAGRCLNPGGRIGILSFHSGEDRLVKGSFRDGLRGGVYQRVSDEPVRAGPGEIRANPRAAPARFRWARRA